MSTQIIAKPNDKIRTKASISEIHVHGIIQGEDFAKSIIRGHWEPLRRELSMQWIPQEARDAMTAMDDFLEEDSYIVTVAEEPTDE